jgi:hypothetical protein
MTNRSFPKETVNFLLNLQIKERFTALFTEKKDKNYAFG